MVRWQISNTRNKLVPKEVTERMLKWFEFKHLPDSFYRTACHVCDLTEPGPERTVALRKLLEAKDAAVRAAIHPGG